MSSVRCSLVAFALCLAGCTGTEKANDLADFMVADSLQGKPKNETRSSFFPAKRLSRYDAIIKKYSRRYGFDWRLIAAQIFVESRFEVEARSRMGAVGLMQILPGTARHLGVEETMLLKPEQNIALGCLYDRRLYNLWKNKEGTNRIAFTFASYNAGRSRVLRAERRAASLSQWAAVKSHLPRETQNYVGRIFAKYSEYKKSHF
ncbi:MAG: transglycosylase SLT domain-containing protein [bacterium]